MGETVSLQAQLAGLQASVKSIKGDVEEIKSMTKYNREFFEKYVTHSEFNRYKGHAEPILIWGNERMAIEKFVIGIVSFLGVSQTVAIIALVIKLMNAGEL
jgi:hypothetical protein